MTPSKKTTFFESVWAAINWKKELRDWIIITVVIWVVVNDYAQS